MKFGFTNLPVGFLKVVATLTFVSMLLVYFFSLFLMMLVLFLSLFLKSYCSNGCQLYRSFTETAAPAHFTGLLACVCASVLLVRLPPPHVSVLNRQLPLLEPPAVTEMFHHTEIRQQPKYASLVLNLMFSSLFFEYCTDDCC